MLIQRNTDGVILAVREESPAEFFLMAEALRVAARTYAKDAADMEREHERDVHGGCRRCRVAKQLRQQAANAEAWAAAWDPE